MNDCFTMDYEGLLVDFVAGADIVFKSEVACGAEQDYATMRGVAAALRAYCDQFEQDECRFDVVCSPALNPFELRTLVAGGLMLDLRASITCHEPGQTTVINLSYSMAPVVRQWTA